MPEESSFVPTGFSDTIFRQRYAITEDETWDECCSRLAKQMALAEIPDKMKMYEEKFKEVLVNNLFVPGGRIWYGSGKNNPFLLNCFVLKDDLDSKEGWGELAREMIITSMAGGGCGISFSDIRPENAPITRGGTCPGPVTAMEMIDACAEPVRSGGGRRAALMFSLDLQHPDVETFLNAKLVKGKLTHANVSVWSKNTTEFIKAVKAGEEIELSWKNQFKRKINAKHLWDTIVTNAYNSAEPGFLNAELAENESNIGYIEPLSTTNPCVTGDTLIATLDGPKTFGELAYKGKDVLVYAWHPDTKLPVVRWMRNPHKTRIGVPILEVKFDSGLILRGTPDHHVYSFRGKKVKLKDLKVGKSVRAFSLSSDEGGRLRAHGWDPKKGSVHQWVHRMVWENANGPIPPDMVCHHIDENTQNNDINNLSVVTVLKHNQIHYPTRFANSFDGKCKNHKVISIKEAGCEDVYNGCVEDAHSYIIVDPKPVAGLLSGIISANCGEIFLSTMDCCCLGHLVLFRFVSNTEVNWHELANTVRLGVRFLDNVLSVNHYPLPEMKDKSNKLRRIGLGVTGLADMLALLNLRYGSTEANEFIDKLFRFISKQAYEASIMLAIEKGPFPAFNAAKHLESGYMQRMSKKIRSLVAEHGLRNCALLTCAPTGTVSILSDNCSAAIEPMFAPAYRRNYWVKEKREQELVFHPLFAKFMQEGRSVDHFIGSRDLTVRDHMEVQKIIQKHVDNAVSKTINIPQDYPIEDVSKLWLEYLPYLKGTTFYRENTRGYYNEKTGIMEEPPLVALSLEEAKELYKVDHSPILDTIRDTCRSGVCDL